MIGFDLDIVGDGSVRIEFDKDAQFFPDFARLSTEENIQLVSTVAGFAEIEKVEKNFVVTGEVRATVQFPCSACLKPIEHKVVNSFSVTYVRDYKTDDSEEELELTSTDLEYELFEGKSIDITEIVQEQVMLGIPIRDICRQGCKGVCQFCGLDKNYGTCECDAPVFNNKFADLKKISFDK